MMNHIKMSRLKRAIHAFITIMSDRNISYADDRFCFIRGTKEDIYKHIQTIELTTIEELRQNETLREAKEILSKQ